MNEFQNYFWYKRISSFDIGFAKKFPNICTAKTAWQRDFILSFVSLITQIGLVQDVPIKIYFYEVFMLT